MWLRGVLGFGPMIGRATRPTDTNGIRIRRGVDHRPKHSCPAQTPSTKKPATSPAYAAEARTATSHVKSHTFEYEGDALARSDADADDTVPLTGVGELGRK